MILGKKKTVPESMPKEAALSKGNGSDNNGEKGVKEQEEATMWGNKGNALVENSMYSEAIKCYEKALEINPNSMEAWNNKGLALARTGRLAEAVQCYDKALELDPADAEVMYNKGISLALLGKPSEAIECYDKLLSINPGDSDAWCSKGDVLFESGKFEEALNAYNKSIGIDPKDETTWNNRGMTLVKLNRFSEAIESYDKALEINPKIEKIWSNKGLAMAKMEESKDKVDLQKIAASMPKEDKSASIVEKQPSEQLNMAPAKQESEPTIVKDTNSIDKDADIKNETISHTNDKPVAAAGIPVLAQAGAKSEKQESGHELFIEKAESIANDKLADIEKYLLSLPVDEKPPAIEIPPSEKACVQPANQGVEIPSGTASSNTVDEAVKVSTQVTGDDIKTAPVIETPPARVDLQSNKQNLEPGLPVSKQEETSEQASAGEKAGVSTLESANEVKPSSVIVSSLSGQVDNKSDKQGPENEPSVVKDEPTNISKPASNGKCVVSVPVDAYIKNPFSDRQPQDLKKPKELLVMGNTLYSLGKYEYAIESFDKSLQIDPTNNTAWNNKGLSLGKLGRLDEAINCYDKALEINPADYVVLNNKGSALYKKGNIEEALQCYKSACGLKPDSKTAKRGIKICTESINKLRKPKK